MQGIEDTLRHILEKKKLRLTVKQALNALKRFLWYNIDNLTFNKEKNIIEIEFSDKLKDFNKEEL